MPVPPITVRRWTCRPCPRRRGDARLTELQHEALKNLSLDAIR